jgi:hypothetical protein
LRGLVVRPGLVAKDYMDGKRIQYLHPIRFYALTSTIFFLVLFFVVGPSTVNIPISREKQFKKHLVHLKEEKELLKGTADTTYVNLLLQSLKRKMNGDSIFPADSNQQDLEIDIFGSDADTQATEGWFSSYLEKKMADKRKEVEEEHEGDEGKATSEFIEKLFHKLPQLLFLSMPFFAFFLKLLYFRSRRSSYVEHFIFSIYQYAYLFVIMLMILLIGELRDKIGGEKISDVSDYVVGGLVIYLFIYLLLSMKRFYADRWGRLMLRYLFLLFFFFFTIMILALVIAFITFLW